MSFITGTQMECLYAMPSAATAVTAATQTVLSKGTTAAPYLLPANFFSQQSGSGPGKSLLIKGGGYFTIGGTAVTDIFQVAMDTTAGTYLAGGLIAETGTFTTVINITSGIFRFEVELTASVFGTAGVISALGELKMGAGNNAFAGTLGSGTAVATTTLYGLPIMIGAPNTGITSFNTTQAYYIELFNTWSATTGTPSITLTNYTIFGLN